MAAPGPLDRPGCGGLASCCHVPGPRCGRPVSCARVHIQEKGRVLQESRPCGSIRPGHTEVPRSGASRAESQCLGLRVSARGPAGMAMTGPCGLTAVPSASSVAACGRSVCSDPTRPCCSGRNACVRARGEVLGQNKAGLPQETHLFRERPVSSGPGLSALCSAPGWCRAGSARGGAGGGGGAQGPCLLLEGSKLHQGDSDVCFRCHSALLSGNETPHTDFSPRLRGIGPSKRRIHSSSPWRIRVRSLKSTIYSNIDISPCQKRGALKFPLSTVVRRIAGNVSDNS